MEVYMVVVSPLRLFPSFSLQDNMPQVYHYTLTRLTSVYYISS